MITHAWYFDCNSFFLCPSEELVFSIGRSLYMRFQPTLYHKQPSKRMGPPEIFLIFSVHGNRKTNKKTKQNKTKTKKQKQKQKQKTKNKTKQNKTKQNKTNESLSTYSPTNFSSQYAYGRITKTSRI